MTSAQLAAHLLSVIEEELGPRPRLELPAGVHLTRQGWPVHGVFLVLSGSVALHQSSSEGADVLLHHASSGPLIGLNSFTRRSLASFTAKTTTPVQAVRITMEQLERVMAKQPGIASLLAMVSMRALSDRLVRAEQLHIEKERLADQLEIEHETTARATAEELKAARSELEEAAQFAMLGQMAAGIAHELNNPIAAITRSADHLATDTAALVSALPALEAGRSVLDAAREGEWLAPREQRRLTRDLAQTIGDRRVAAQLVQMGITDVAAAQALVRRGDDFAPLQSLHQIGSSIRDIELAARRITGLVQSLRSYSRSGDYLVHDVDIHEGIEDTLRLAGPQLAGVTITRHYAPDLPPITCYPSRLEQVWTNVVINAAEAMAEVTDYPEIAITTARRGNDHIRIRFEDNGPGIAEDLLERIFLPRFTTKQGTVHYGLGMGLGICRQIIDAHDGSIKASNGAHGACMTITLPIAGPAPEAAPIEE
nr:ATP-binding protein [Nanchangia anserum]